MQDIFYLPIPNLPIPAGGHFGERGGVLFCSQSLLVDPQNLGNGSLLCSVTELPESARKLHPLSLLSLPRGCSTVQSVISCPKVLCSTPVTSCPMSFCPPLPRGAPTSFQSHLSVLLLRHKARKGSQNVAGGALAVPCAVAGVEGLAWGMAEQAARWWVLFSP